MILHAAESSQHKLQQLMNDVKQFISEQGIQIEYYNPGVKEFDSALRKVKRGAYGIPNLILILNDAYRGSIIFENIDGIKMGLQFITDLMGKYNFEKVYENNTINAPYSSGYRDINMRIKDNDNKGLVGELQLHLCPIQKFKMVVGHKIYEKSRELSLNNKETKDMLNSISKYGYNQALSIGNSGCIKNITKKGGKRRKGKKRQTRRK